VIDYADQQREATAIRADMREVYEIVSDAKARYVKSKLRARSKRQAKDKERLFADLTPYASKEEIQDSYGYEEITLNELDRLMHLWDMREQHTEGGQKYHDRVIEMLNKALAHIGDDYQDILEDADQASRENERLVRDNPWRERA
jgi:ElaB/YqjD/DUF883 family membrane-anchored ribosome-binding protein